MRKLVRRHPLGTCFFLAFALSWWAWPLTLLNPNSSPVIPFAPIFVAIVVAAVAGGKQELRELLKRLVRWKVHPVWYLVALLGPFATTGAAVGLRYALGSSSVSVERLNDWYLLPLAFLTTLLINGPLWEELGWRGFALPRMQRRLGALKASLFLGLVWGLWHLPLLVSDPEAQRPILPYLTWIVAASVVITWVFNKTNESVLITTIMHAAINSAAAFFLPIYPDPNT